MPTGQRRSFSSCIYYFFIMIRPYNSEIYIFILPYDNEDCQCAICMYFASRLVDAAQSMYDAACGRSARTQADIDSSRFTALKCYIVKPLCRLPLAFLPHMCYNIANHWERVRKQMNRRAASYFSYRFYGFIYDADKVSFGLAEICAA